MKVQTAAALLLGSIVCGCGGGGGSAPIAVVPGSPLPVPSPTSTGTPTPPAATYRTYAELSGDQTFRTSCASVRTDTTPLTTTPVTAFGQPGLILSYAATPRTYTVSADSTVPLFAGSHTFGPNDLDASAPAGVIGYAKGGTTSFAERLTIGVPAAGSSSSVYTRGLSLRVPAGVETGTPTTPAAQFSCIFGVPTRLDDQPRTSQVTFTRTGANGVAYARLASGPLEAYSLAGSVVSFRVDLATYSIVTSVRLVGVLQTPTGPASTTTELGTYTSTIQIDERGFYNGLLSSTDRQVNFASFGGWFFGPQGSEAAYTYSISATDASTGRRIAAVGNAIALR